MKQMNKVMKVARWEIKRNLKNKSFIIGLFLTPVLFLVFFALGSIFGDSDNSEENSTRVFVHDELHVFENLQEVIESNDLNWELHLTNVEEKNITKELESSENTAYIFMDNRALEDGIVPVYTSEDIDPLFINQVQLLEAPIKALKLKHLGLSDEQLAAISQRVVFEAKSIEDLVQSDNTADDKNSRDIFDQGMMNRIIPGAFAGIILLSIVFTGMMIFQSASQEKKDKIAEIILSSLTPADLMQGKIIGYFILGIIQVVVFLVLVLPVALWKIDFPILKYVFVPELILLLTIAILGYLLFASIFVGIGATMSDISTTGNFQGMVLMLPFLPFFFIGPVVDDPAGLMAQILSYIPFTSPGILILRLSILEEWPWVEIMISLAVLIVSVWLFMKLAGKIFKVGILMYGKNATPREIWKWLRA